MALYLFFTIKIFYKSYYERHYPHKLSVAQLLRFFVVESTHLGSSHLVCCIYHSNYAFYKRCCIYDTNYAFYKRWYPYRQWDAYGDFMNFKIGQTQSFRRTHRDRDKILCVLNVPIVFGRKKSPSPINATLKSWG
jgi:hypothetical protein